jgi:hypothetical protein
MPRWRCGNQLRLVQRVEEFVEDFAAASCDLFPLGKRGLPGGNGLPR